MQVKKILFITLSNIGDAILTLPVLDYLKKSFAGSQITVMTGLRAKEIFENDPLVKNLLVYDKHARLREKIKLFRQLKQKNFDLIVDLRNSFLGRLLSFGRRGVLRSASLVKSRHMKDIHMSKVATKIPHLAGNSLHVTPQDEDYVTRLLEENNISQKDNFAVISPGARSNIKRWPAEKFMELIYGITQTFKLKVVLVGDKDDVPITGYITERSKYAVTDLAGKTSILQLAALLKRAKALICNDSASMHLASYLNIPVVALFGPTDETKYGPWSKTSVTVKKEISCRPCKKAQCKFNTLECMHLIKVEDVMRALNNVLAQNPEPRARNLENFKRILIARTDRIGDVLLSTPVIKALRENYPNAYIAMMVSPYAKDIVEANPYLDQVIIYDKDTKHKSWARSIKFSQRLKNKRFELAIILHPTNRVHLITFLAGIRRRIGFDRKLGILLTDRIKHTKQMGLKHELEYTLDLIRHLGIEPENKNLFIPIRQESEDWVDELFKQERIKKEDLLLAINPGASCPSKIWPNERFAEVADRLIEKYGFKVLVVSGPKDTSLAASLIKHMRHSALDLSGKTSLSQLASLLKRSNLFISNDSGPVHIATAVGVPVIAIFGRNQTGLSPRRWGPVGRKDKILHKQVGCINCLAHNCKNGFACLKAITVEDVYEAADQIMQCA